MADCHQSKRFDNRSIFISNPDSEIKKLGLLDKRSKKKDNPMILENQINQNNRLIRKAKEKINCIETLSYRNLTRLDLSNSQLKVIPYSLQYLSNLEILNLDNNELSTLPEIVTRISCLKFLSLSDNKVQALPDSLGDLAALETLIVSSNLLRAMPKSCENLCNLKTLDVSKNYLVEIPRGMRNLEELDLSSNKYIKLSSAPMSKKLKFLYMRDLGRDINFPLWLFTHRVRILEILATDNTVFKHVMMPPWHGRDPEIRKLKKLSVKDSRFDKKFVEYFTSQTSQLESLKISNIAPKLSNNTFYDPPITRLRNPEVLTEIEIRGTGLVGNCSIIANCLNLVKLDVGNNNISDLSDDICQLKNLEILRVDQNLLKELPKNIGSITSLRELKASKNNIGNLPVSIQQFKNLNYLDLYENNIAMFPNEVRKIKQIMGIDLDQNYFKIENLFVSRFHPFYLLLFIRQ